MVKRILKSNISQSSLKIIELQFYALEKVVLKILSKTALIFLIFSFSSFAQLLPQQDELRQTHIQANVPNEKEFDSLLKRELKEKFKISISNIKRINYELFRKEPTQSGLSYPKYYAWVKIYNSSDWPEYVGAIRIAAIEKKKLEITDSLDYELVLANPKMISEIFPGSLVKSISEKAQTTSNAFKKCMSGKGFGKVSRYPIENGYFLGTDKGEWIGVLEFYPKHGKAYQILSKNIKSIIMLNKKIYALSGLGHLTINEGELHELSFDNKKWIVSKTYKLPGEPLSSEIISDNEIKISTRNGIVSFEKDKKFKNIVCELN